MRSLLLSGTLLGILAGCASGSGTSDDRPVRHATVRVETNVSTHELEMTVEPTALLRVVEFPAQRVWEVLPAVYADLGLRNARADESRLTLQVNRLEVNRNLGRARLSQYLDCGTTLSMANADQYAVTLGASTRLVPVNEGSTRIESVVTATARPIDTAGGVTCLSRGVLERRIAEEVGRRL